MFGRLKYFPMPTPKPSPLPNPPPQTLFCFIANKSIGIILKEENRNEFVENIIKKEEELPIKKTIICYTSTHNQIELSIKIVENIDSSIKSVPNECKTIARVEMHFSEPLPIYSAVKVTLELGTDGRLAINCMELKTKNHVLVELMEADIVRKEMLNRFL